MFIYSQKTVRFSQEIKDILKKVISKEANLRVHGDRFYNSNGTASYPIKIVIYNNRRMLGYFDSDFYELGFHERLMHANKKQLQDIIRHEVAHYITFIERGNTPTPHSNEFRALCQRLGWGEEVYRAAIYLEEADVESQAEESAVLRKVQKLMSLATSSNPHEAEQAMLKSQQLLLKHNLEHTHPESDEEQFVLKRILKQKKETSKMRCIAQILETFFVSTVYNRADGHIYLEILGSPVNVEIAEHVANVLQHELDNLWHQAQQFSIISGAVARNSFFTGLARGYCNKVQALKRHYSSEVTQALMVIEKTLEAAKDMAYSRLSTKRSQGRHCGMSSALGEMMGSQLTINPALKKSPAAGSKELISRA